MTIKLKYIIGLSLIVASCTDAPQSDNDILNYKYKDVNGAMVDTIKNTFFLNGEQIPYQVISHLSPEDQSRMSGVGATEAKQAIKMYGEKYRNGIILFEVK